MLTGSMKSFTPLDSNTWSATPPLSSIISPYWNPEQPPPCTNTRSPLPTLFSSLSSSLIFEAAAGDTFTIFSFLQGDNPPQIIRSAEDRFNPSRNCLGAYFRQFPGRFLLNILV